MNNNPLVSIVIPTFNRKKILLETIKNVLQQTYKNFEIIIVNDGYSNDLKSIIQSLKNEKIIYTKTKKNLGCALARVLGVKMSSGEYIAFLDDDDEWDKNYLKNQLNIFRKNYSIDFVISNYKINYFNKNKEIKNMKKYAIDFQNNIFRRPGPFLQCCLFKKKILKNMKTLMDSKSIPSEDWDFFINLSYINPIIGFSKQVGFTWNLSNESQSSDLFKEAIGIENIIKKHKKKIIQLCGIRILSDHYRRIARIYEQLNDYKKIK